MTDTSTSTRYVGLIGFTPYELARNGGVTRAAAEAIAEGGYVPVTEPLVTITDEDLDGVHWHVTFETAPEAFPQQCPALSPAGERCAFTLHTTGKHTWQRPDGWVE